MKKLFLAILGVFIALPASAQDITGTWNGLLKVPGAELRIVIHFEKTSNGYSATLDSPDQGAKGLPASSVTINKDTVTIEVKSISGKIVGKIESDAKISATLMQMGMKFPLDLVRGDAKEKVLIRPQEPVKPYPYYSEEVKFVNKIDGDTLAGTLTLPQKTGIYPVVVMITGSGPQNRDEELFGHKPFLVIADFLTRNGIGVLRYDDRGVASSTGNFNKATSLDLSRDAESAVSYLMTRKDVNKKKIGLAGHSEGGVIAPMVAARNKNVSFVVLLAGTGVRGDVVLLTQTKAIAKASGASDKEVASLVKMNETVYNMVMKSTDDASLKSELKSYIKKTMDEDSINTKHLTEEDKAMRVNGMVDQIASPWMKYFMKYDPATALVKLKIPVLAMNGTNDLQVLPDVNLPAIKRSLEKAGNKKFKTVEIPGLNHLFQECEKGSPDEYPNIEQTVSPKALDEMLKWIKIQIK